MALKPIFVATHPRSCSTAFERVFMKRIDLQCLHEPFGDAYYYGPERMGLRFENDQQGRLQSGFAESTYGTTLDRFKAGSSEGKRLFIKDMAYYLMAPNEAPTTIAPSLNKAKKGVGTLDSEFKPIDSVHASSLDADAIEGERGNPTVIPRETLDQFHFVFLIRHPRYGIPSYFRCTVPPLDKVTGFHNFDPSEAGYGELRKLFDYLRSTGQIGPAVFGQETHMPEHIDSKLPEGHHGHTEICVIDADDLLDQPARIIEKFCAAVGIEYDPGMLSWESKEDQDHAREVFQKWKGFHEDVIESTGLRPRAHPKATKTVEEEDAGWREKFGENGAKVIRDTVNANLADYEYLKQFTVKV